MKARACEAPRGFHLHADLGYTAAMESLGRIFDPAMQRPRVPAGHIVYAVGDLHGRIDLMERMQAMILADAAKRQAEKRTIVYLGDYVDRGPASKGVVAKLLEGPLDGFEQVCLMGNHESWMLDFLDDAKAGAGWLMNGGDATLASYGVRVRPGARLAQLEAARQAFAKALPADHKAFLEDLSLMWRAGDYIFVHAGVRPGVPLGDQDPQDLIWIRDEFLWSEADFGAIIVHGHTISRHPDEQENRIGVDTGAFATGRLTCLCLEGVDRRFLQT